MQPDDPDVAELKRQVAEAQQQQELRRARSRFTSYVNGGADIGLAPTPRRVPATYLLAELLPFRWWYIWALFMVAITPIALWASLPALIGPAAFASIAAIYAVQLRGTRTRMALLKWGQVATVTGTAILSRGTYYSGTTWYNAPLPVARGWQVSRPLYSGPSTKTQIGYTLGGYQGQITVRGREYTDGVVLADERRPQRALCVTSFAYDLDRDLAGNWTGRLRPRLQLGMAVWLLILIVWLGGAAAYATGYAQRHCSP